MPNVTLMPMTEPAYAAWLAQAVPEYAQDKIVAGTWPAAVALANAQRDFASLLPQGLATPDALLWTIAVDGAGVGSLWVSWDQDQRRFFIYDIKLDAASQDQGIGTAALRLLDEAAAARGVRHIGLHVFGRNHRARHVYEKAGFAVTDLEMEKRV
ncbi:GNAT family N-acetyltransferase [Lacticaseibacillus suihuaensis]